MQTTTHQHKATSKKVNYIKAVLPLIIGVSSLFTVNTSMAAQAPQALVTDSGIKAVNYDPNNVVTIVGKPFFTTTIQFSKGEVVNGNSIVTGSGAAWMAEAYKDKPNYLAIKPTMADSDTNLTVVTNKHTYYFHLISQKNVMPTYAVIFHYPNDDLQAKNKREAFIKAQNNALLTPYNDPNRYNWDYTFNGDKAIVPVRVFDDGTFTYMKFIKNVPQPAIFAVDNPNGAEAVVNIRRKGDWVIIERVSPQFTLRLGQYHVVSVFNKPYIQAIEDNQPYFTAPTFKGNPKAYHPSASNYRVVNEALTNNQNGQNSQKSQKNTVSPSSKKEGEDLATGEMVASMKAAKLTQNQQEKQTVVDQNKTADMTSKIS